MRTLSTANVSAGQGTAKSQPRETLERETHLGSQPSVELQDLTVVCSEGDLSSKDSHGVSCFLRKGYSILLLTASFQNTDIRKNMVVTSTSFLLGSIFPQENKCQGSVTPLACKCLISDLLSTNFLITSSQINILQAEKALSRDIFPQKLLKEHGCLVFYM